MKDNLKKDYIWNSAGTISFSLVSLLLNILVIHIVGEVQGGIFTFGFTVFAAQLLTVANFGVKTIQAIDVKRNYSFKEFKTHRIFTVILSLIIGVIYLLFLYKTNVYDFNKSLIIFVLMFHGIIEGYFDVYEAEYQRENMLYKAGAILFLRSIGWALVFISFLYITKNLLLSSIIGMITKFLIGYFTASVKSKNDFVDEKDIKVDVIKTLKSVTIAVLPLFLAVFLDNFIYTVNKFAIDYFLGDVYSGYYSFIFLPATALYLLQYLISRPLITPLSVLYNNDFEEYKKRQKKIIIASIFICIAFLLVVVIFSKLYLNIINFITSNRYISISDGAYPTLFFVALGGTFYSFYVMTYYMLVIENMQKKLLVMYLIMTPISLVVATVLTRLFGMKGAALSYAISMFILTFTMFFMHVYAVRKKDYELSKR